MLRWLRTFRLVPIVLDTAMMTSGVLAQPAEPLQISGDVAFMHDPSIARDGNTYDASQRARRRTAGSENLRLLEELFTA